MITKLSGRDALILKYLIEKIVRGGMYMNPNERLVLKKIYNSIHKQYEIESDTKLTGSDFAVGM